MITRLDRVQLATRNPRRSAETWQRLFDAQIVREDHVEPLRARRTVLRAGESEIELLEPAGVGPVAQHVARSRSALFAVGFAADDLALAAARLEERNIHHVRSDDQLHLSGEWLGIPGLRLVLTADEPRRPAGLLLRLYEATHLMYGQARAAARFAEVLGLDPAGFAPIESEPFGYRGTLCLLDPDKRLDRLETIEPTDPLKPIGRFLARQGPCLYMCYVEARDTAAVRERLREHAAGAWTGPDDDATPPDNLFVHPRALHGLLLGISRESVAWTWSGHPDRVRPAA